MIFLLHKIPLNQLDENAKLMVSRMHSHKCSHKLILTPNDQVNHFSLQISHQNISFSIFGFWNVNNTLIFSVRSGSKSSHPDDRN